jgi:Zn-dependent protease
MMTETPQIPEQPFEVDAPPVLSASAPAAERRSQQGPRVPARVIDEYDPHGRPVRRRVLLPLGLFAAACLTTFAAGVYGWEIAVLDDRFSELARANWRQGLIYMGACMAVLLAHELGHFFLTLRYRIPASFPLFIPMPIMMTGTMGAVIAMDGSRADRKQLFDIGIAGPLAGLVLTVPLVLFGIKTATVRPAEPAVPMSHHAQAEMNEQAIHPRYGRPLLVQLLLPRIRPDLVNKDFENNALYMAGWVGMLITGLNMMPVSQLDGGHIIFAMFGKRSRLIARAFLLGTIGYIVVSENYTWLLMIVLVTFLGADHPPTANDDARIGPIRWALGAASLLIPIFCFAPVPLL